MVAIDLANKFLDEAVKNISIKNISVLIEDERTIQVSYSATELGILYNPRIKVYGDIDIIINRIKELKSISARIKQGNDK